MKIDKKVEKFKNYLIDNHNSIVEYANDSITNALKILDIVEKTDNEKLINLSRCNAIINFATIFEISWKIVFQSVIDYPYPDDSATKYFKGIIDKKINETEFANLKDKGYSIGEIFSSLYNFQRYSDLKDASKELFGHNINTTLNEVLILTPENAKNKDDMRKFTVKKRQKDSDNINKLLDLRHEIIHMAGDNLIINRKQVDEFSSSLKDYITHGIYSLKIHGKSFWDIRVKNEINDLENKEPKS